MHIQHRMQRLATPCLAAFAITASLWAQAGTGSIDGTVTGSGAAAPAAQFPAGDPGNIQTIDYMVPHISTVPANSGKRVELFVREKVRGRNRGNRSVVLMIHGATTSVVPAFDLQFENYSWMEYLATAGFDVFAMDQTGYGLSPRPMMDDPCNTLSSEQQSYLLPKPLAQPCSPAYPFQLTTIQSDWDEIDTVVEYLRRFRNVDKVSLVAWSRGGPRAGGYAALYPDKVERLFLLAPGYIRLSPSNPPGVMPQPGVPSNVLGSAAFHDDWDTQVKCENQFTPKIRGAVTSTMLDFDPLGSTWGAGGTRRAPNWNSPGPGFNSWGWNAALASQVRVPTLLIRGDVDTKVPAVQVSDLYGDLVAAPQKVFVHVACASHYLIWENQHMSLLQASEEWLRSGTFAGQTNGSFAVDITGGVQKDQ
jgi:pimeloyl-ACP methyl ester carboxylesterase